MSRPTLTIIAGANGAGKSTLRSLQNLPAAAEIADRVLLFDNSDDLGYQPVGLVGRGPHQWFDPLPVWAAELRKGFPRATDG